MARWHRSAPMGIRRMLGMGVGVLALIAIAATCARAGAYTGPRDSAGYGDGSGEVLGGPGRWLSVGLLSGSTLLDGSLADYQWDTRPQAAWGAQALIGARRLGVGVRGWTTQTTQNVGLPGVESPRVQATSWELVGQGRVATWWGTQVLATASAGRLHLAYDPDRITLEPVGPGVPINVDFEPVDEWIAGGGVALLWPVAGRWTTSIALDHRIFGMDTAHRNGDEIEFGRQTFGDWSARPELAWLYGQR